MFTRRSFAAAGCVGVLVPALAPMARSAQGGGAPADWKADIERIEAGTGGRLGVAAVAVGTGRSLLHRADERFPLCSTAKVLACGAVLARVDAGTESLDRRIRFSAADLTSYSPATEAHAGGDGMTLVSLCEAAITLSDNTAMNLLLASLGAQAR